MTSVFFSQFFKWSSVFCFFFPTYFHITHCTRVHRTNQIVQKGKFRKTRHYILYFSHHSTCPAFVPTSPPSPPLSTSPTMWLYPLSTSMVHPSRRLLSDIRFFSLFISVLLRHCIWEMRTFSLTAVCAEGVTFLALGNGAPDIFSAIAAFSHPHTSGLAIGALFGRHSLTRQQHLLWRPGPLHYACPIFLPPQGLVYLSPQ